MRPLARIPLVATAALMLLTSTASAQFAGSDVLGGDGPTVIGPGPVPGVGVFASCTVASPSGTTVWFGYENTLTERRVALVGATNTVAVDTVAVNGVANRGQTTQFQPGVVDRAFAVTVPNGSSATWAVTPTNILGVSDVPLSATSSPSTPPCAEGVGVRSATPQIVGGLVPTIGATPVNQLISNALLVRSSLGFSTAGVVSACSDGGRALSPRVLWGYGVAAPGQAGGLIVPAGAPFAALSADKILRTDVYANGEITFQRSYQATRRIVDPQRISVFGTLQEQLRGTAQVAWGYSSIAVIADVEARCKFAEGVVTSSTTVWVDSERGSSIDFHTVTDRLTQSTRPAAFCLSPYPTSGCDVRAIGVGPGGRSFR